MLNRTQIKIIIAFLFLICLSVALYLRRPKDTWEPKWGEGLISCSENAYYNNIILEVIQKWTEASEKMQSDSDIFNQTLLVIDLDEKAIWLEKEGKLIGNCYIELPEKVRYEVVNVSEKDLSQQKGRIIFRNVDDIIAKVSSEQFILRGIGNKYKLGLQIINTRKGAYRVKGLWPAATNVKNIVSSLIVTEEEYEKNINSLSNTDRLQNNKEKIPPRILSELEKNQKAWKRIERKLFIEIEKQVHRAGYQLNKLSVSPQKSFNSADASVIGYKYNILIKMLDKSPYANTNLGIIRLKDDIWYVASKPETKKKNKEQTMKLEFMIHLDSDISKKQEKEFIKQGREIFKKYFND